MDVIGEQNRAAHVSCLIFTLSDSATLFLLIPSLSVDATGASIIISITSPQVSLFYFFSHFSLSNFILGHCSTSISPTHSTLLSIFISDTRPHTHILTFFNSFHLSTLIPHHMQYRHSNGSHNEADFLRL